jgi:hypothetical protein
MTNCTKQRLRRNKKKNFEFFLLFLFTYGFQGGKTKLKSQNREFKPWLKHIRLMSVHKRNDQMNIASF